MVTMYTYKKLYCTFFWAQRICDESSTKRLVDRTFSDIGYKSDNRNERKVASLEYNYIGCSIVFHCVAPGSPHRGVQMPTDLNLLYMYNQIHVRGRACTAVKFGSRMAHMPPDHWFS